jgi:hypothetical protein
MELWMSRAWMRGVAAADLYTGDMTLDGGIAVGLRMVCDAKPLIENMDLQIKHIEASLMSEPDEERRGFLIESYAKADYIRQRTLEGLYRGFAMVQVTKRVQIWLNGGQNA